MSSEQEQLPLTSPALRRIESLIRKSNLREIVANGPTDFFIESQDGVAQVSSQFVNEGEYESWISDIGDEIRAPMSQQHPIAHGNLDGFRVQLVSRFITGGHSALTLRKCNFDQLDWNSLQKNQWAPESALQMAQRQIHFGWNILVVGPTGSGKTSVLNVMLKELRTSSADQLGPRVIILEDVEELQLPNAWSLKLVSQEDPRGQWPAVSLSELVRLSLRLRPDRLVLGEMRGPEAKDLLMALSSGHRGSWGSLHASTASEALLRLEMLAAMGAPQWSPRTLKRLISLALDAIWVVNRFENFFFLQSIHRLGAAEESGILLESLWERPSSLTPEFQSSFGGLQLSR